MICDRAALRRGGLVLAALLVSIASAQPAAARPLFTAPVVLGMGGTHPVVSVGFGGDVTVAWVGASSGVFVARRGALDTAFGTPQQIADGLAEPTSLRVVRGLGGDVAVAWTVPHAMQQLGPTQSDVRAAVAAPASSAFQPVMVPDAFAPEIALAADGTLAIAYSRIEQDVVDAYLSLRPRGAALGPAHALAPTVAATPTIAAAAGRSWRALWLAQAPGSAAVVAGADVQPDGTAGPAQVLSDPAGDPITAQAPRLVADARRDLLSAWGSNAHGTQQPLGNLPFSDHVEIVERPAGGAWSTPRSVRSPDGASVTGVTTAINDRGDAVVAWQGSALTTMFRPAGGSFGSIAGASGGLPSYQLSNPIAIDADGVAIAVRNVAAPTGLGPGLIGATLRVRDAPPAAEIPISPTEQFLSPPSVDTDAYGNGVVAWSSQDAGQPVQAVTYSRRAPALTTVRVHTRDIALRASEAASVRIVVRRVGAKSTATQRAVVAPGINRIAFVARIRRRLRPAGSYVLTIVTADHGPRTRTYRIKYRRRVSG